MTDHPRDKLSRDLIKNDFSDQSVRTFFDVLMPPLDLFGIGPASNRLANTATYLANVAGLPTSVQKELMGICEFVQKKFGRSYGVLRRAGLKRGHPLYRRQGNTTAYAGWLAPIAPDLEEAAKAILGTIAALPPNVSKGFI